MRSVIFAVTALLVVVTGCGGDSKRVVIVFDPTIHGADSTRIEEQILVPLHHGLQQLPPQALVDLYFVKGEGHVSGGPDFRDSVTFDPYQKVTHATAVSEVADRVTARAREAWLDARIDTRKSASCILSAVRRVSTDLPVNPREQVALVVLSDLREVCSDFGPINMEREIPQSFDLPASADLRGLDGAHLILADGLTNRNAASEEALYGLWSKLLSDWAFGGEVSRGYGFPKPLFR